MHAMLTAPIAAQAPALRRASSRSSRGKRIAPLRIRAAIADPDAALLAKTSVPEWKLPRDPLAPGAPPPAGTWGPTNQTIEDWRSIYRNTSLSTTDGSAPRTIDPARVTGTIPKDLSGTLFRNGPGLLEIFGKRLNQFFDGDGLVYSIAFEDGEGEEVK